MPYSNLVITVTWMDGKQESYPVSEFTVREGVLYLQPREHTQDPNRAIPVANVRMWTT